MNEAHVDVDLEVIEHEFLRAECRQRVREFGLVSAMKLGNRSR